MDDVCHILAKKLADAIGEAAGKDPEVQAVCHEVRKAGFEPRIQMDAVIYFLNKFPGTALVTAPARESEMSKKDKRFLQSLRIASEEKTA